MVCEPVTKYFSWHRYISVIPDLSHREFSKIVPAWKHLGWNVTLTADSGDLNENENCSKCYEAQFTLVKLLLLKLDATPKTKTAWMPRLYACIDAVCVYLFTTRTKSKPFLCQCPNQTAIVHTN